MKEIICLALLAGVSYPIAGVINAEKWVLLEMDERFERAKRDGFRIEDEMRLQHGRNMFAIEQGSYSLNFLCALAWVAKSPIESHLVRSIPMPLIRKNARQF